jgi:hypothetical protein
MKNKIKLLLVLLVSLTCSATWAETEKKELSKSNLAVTDFNEDYGFKMSQKALDTMEISFSSISGNGPWKVPKEALIQLKQSVGVYRRFEGWIDFVLVNVLGSNGDHVSIASADLETGDEVSVTNSKFLRLTEANLKSDTVDSCAH